MVACDHQRIFDTVTGFGGKPILTDPAAPSGTDRIAEAAATLTDTELIVNVQGDEPNLDPASIDQLIELLAAHPEADMATLCTPIRRKEDLFDPSWVKVVFDKFGRALYFSRSVIPYPRTWSDDLLTADPPLFYLHLGIYAYRREFLLSIPKMPRANIEKTESLEQLRVMNEGHTIVVGTVQEKSFGIDTPEDYQRFVELMKNNC